MFLPTELFFEENLSVAIEVALAHPSCCLLSTLKRRHSLGTSYQQVPKVQPKQFPLPCEKLMLLVLHTDWYRFVVFDVVLPRPNTALLLYFGAMFGWTAG